MSQPASAAYTGSIPELYDRYLVPMLFAAYAQDMSRRAMGHAPNSILEVAAGSGVLTRALADAIALPSSITATDLSVPMIEQAQRDGTSRPVTWGQADAAALPFGDESFDLVVCQFGVMFVPDKVRAFSEMHRVLRPGGVLLFSLWDRLEHNGFSDTVQSALAGHFRDDPPRFLPDRVHGYGDEGMVRSDLDSVGFGEIAVEPVSEVSRAATPQVIALAFCHGGPLRMEIEDRDPTGLEAATAVVADALRERYGTSNLVATMRAFVYTTFRS